ncbi:MAG: formate C-acetyltransferase/glycerol dehydratase family glycyl radical enzyme, partial [Planctomycetes bacterium]|nr:formate C-acetyltransferase/glycerol dehydratase family glycyl radical enzyme [Planctomycetota bacterium]
MNDRVRQLRRQSIETRPYLSAERAQLLTAFYQSGAAARVSVPVGRALAFRYLMEHRAICINEGELIVGERGPAPKATPTYPELCCHTLEDLDVLATRERTPFAVSDDVRRVYAEEIIPFWTGRTIRERLFGSMTEGWHAAFGAGVFTEFMEQRAFGHAVLDDKIYHRGFLDFKERLAARRRALDPLGDPEAFDKDEELKAMEIAADAIILFAERHAAAARDLAAREKDPARRAELER